MAQRPARYRYLRRVGSGAAGGVYLVEDCLHGGQPIALKGLDRSSDPAFRNSFVREFALLSSLSLPGVAQVYDLGVMPEGQEIPAGPFFTRAFVDGKPLDAWASEQPLEQAVALLVRALQVVSSIHRAGIVHGDLKPANVIVDAAHGPNLIDFGLSSRVGVGDRFESSLSGSGTPLFMAPELFHGGEPTVASDVYALGATVWALATGRPPFAELGGAALQAKLRGELPRHEAATGLRESLLQAALSGLAPDRRQRAASADELAAMLERALRRSSRPRGVSSAPLFTPPRPRGREELLEALEGASPEPSTQVVLGARGMGKSCTLRELKWRLQLSGRSVFELRFGGEASPGLAQLASQTLGGQLAGSLSSDPVEQLVSTLGAAGATSRPVLLIDDLQLADLDFVRALGVALRELGADAAAIVATSSLSDGSRLQALPAPRTWELTPLGGEVQRALVRDCLGSVEPALAEALVDHAAGNPGLLVEALALVFARPEITAQEVSQLPAGEIGAGLLRQRFEQLSPPARSAFLVLVAARATAEFGIPESVVAGLLGEAWPQTRVELVAARLLRESGAGMWPTDSVLAEWVRRSGGETLAVLAKRVLEGSAAAELAAPLVAELCVAAGDRMRFGKTVNAAVNLLRQAGLSHQALVLARAGLPAARGALSGQLQLAAAELEEGLGELEACLATARTLMEDAGQALELRTRARLVSGRAHVARGDLNAAAEVLSELSEASSGALFAPACRELARVHLRRGDRVQAGRVVEAGLAAAPSRDAARAELLAIEAWLISMGGDRAQAEARFEQALGLASELGLERERAQVLGYQAMAYDRAGELSAAVATYQRALAASRVAGDVGLMGTFASNYGAISHRLGQTDVAAEHYALAGRWLRRAGRFAMAIMAQNNLAFLHLYLGAFERARAIAETSLADAEQWQIEAQKAQALQILGDVAARQGQTEGALVRYDAAAGHFERVARKRELTEVCLDTAECLLDRSGASDASAAAARLARARSLVESEGIEDMRTRLKLLLARARAANGDIEGALGDLERLAKVELKEHERELGWQVLTAQAQLHRALGSEVLARRCLLDAAEIIEREAARVPREARDGFRADPRRRAVIDGATATASLTASRFETTASASRSGRVDPRFERLLEIIKRLARERDLSRLLERITDAAVELSGAERGFVLLLDEREQLMPHTVRASVGREQDASVAFSRSIAEAVLIDGEPIVTVNARDDRRVNEFMSVHKLMLKSVACVPIRGPERVEGVLYLEHRMRAGRFQDEDVDLLMAFADQSAIALENTRLWGENERRRIALEHKNRELESTKAEMERLLEARTEELEHAQRALSGARSALTESALKHGMIGHGQAMQRVFSLIDRVRDSSVSVVIQGESGTGKELVARAIHAAGARHRAPFVAVNCGALPESLIESELFGHVRGAFTGADRDKKGLFALAQGGTLFLDEFADIPPRMQLDLLRVLQEGRVRPVGSDQDLAVDVRVIVASNRPLSELVREKRLREDLFYRLSVVEVRLPPLRERGEDLPFLCEHLLARIAAKHGGRAKRLTRAVFERLTQESFPGNIRQLEHMLLSAAMMTEGPSIDVRDLPWSDGSLVQPPALDAPDADVSDATEMGADGLEPSELVEASPSDRPHDVRGFKQRERQRILEALERHGWNRVKAATALGMPRRTFYRRLSEFGIL
ncbi:MAG: sigma 54-interacting transcriptional regulator [Myxococcales bacterium]